MEVAVKVTNFTRSKAKNHRFFQLLFKETGAEHRDFCFILNSVSCREGNALLGCMNLKMMLKSFFEKTKTTSMFNFTMKSLL